MMTKENKFNKFIDSTKQGLKDIQLVLQEGHYKLFVKQMVVIVLLILGYRYVNQQLNNQDQVIANKLDAIRIQQSSETDYLESKKRLLELEPLFPSIESKNDWLLRQIVLLFQEAKMAPKIASSQFENTSNPNYVITSLPVELDVSYDGLGRLLAKIENKEDYLRVSSIELRKDSQNLAHNIVKLNFNTVFPKEKLGSTLFKDGGKK